MQKQISYHQENIDRFLDFLQSSVKIIPGIGDAYARLIDKLCGNASILDLLQHLPQNIQPKKNIISLADSSHEIAAFKLTIERLVLHYSRRSFPQKVIAHDKTGNIEILFFNMPASYLKTRLKVDHEYIIIAKTKKTGTRFQTTNPSLICSVDEYARAPALQPIYPLTAGLSQKNIQRFIQLAIKKLIDLPEWISEENLDKTWPSWKQAILTIHNPSNYNDTSPESFARTRLAYDEILVHQLTIQLLKKHRQKSDKKSFSFMRSLRPQILNNFGHELTQSQHRAIREIERDLCSGKRMLRLLQGDVGSGKTIVGFMALAMAVESGYQAVLIAPTEILAEQHYQKMYKLVQQKECVIELLTGSTAAKKHQSIISNLQDGLINILIGTHALLEESIKFKNLELVVIDEQHRFGVHQRMLLGQKGQQPNILIMTATPIPRTLALAMYANIDVSILEEKPNGRQPIETKILHEEKIPELIKRLDHMIKSGSKIFWVCPAIDGDELASKLIAVNNRFAELQKVFGPAVGLLHGQLKSEEKQKTLNSFAQGPLKILVSTTIIEVGVDVPEADIIVIDNANQFGLAQLHQLRGRVGRNNRQAYCILLYKEQLNAIAKARLETLANTQDGFKIAEKDLELRGSGDLLGTQQSGFDIFKFVDVSYHHTLFQKAYQQIKKFLNKDPFLLSPEGIRLRILLKLFGKNKHTLFLEGM